jgi:hypothetical protein
MRHYQESSDVIARNDIHTTTQKSQHPDGIEAVKLFPDCECSPPSGWLLKSVFPKIKAYKQIISLPRPPAGRFSFNKYPISRILPGRRKRLILFSFFIFIIYFQYVTNLLRILGQLNDMWGTNGICMNFDPTL